MKAPPSDHTSPSTPIIDATLDLWSSTGKRNWVSVTGTSMLPILAEGDRLLVEHGCSHPRRGDIIICRWGQGLIAHRILQVSVGAKGNRFLTKGDNTTTLDSVFEESQVIGKALGVEKNGKYISFQTASAQIANRLIANCMLIRESLHNLARLSGTRSSKKNPNWAIRFWRRTERALLSGIIRVLQNIAYR